MTFSLYPRILRSMFAPRSRGGDRIGYVRALQVLADAGEAIGHDERRAIKGLAASSFLNVRVLDSGLASRGIVAAGAPMFGDGRLDFGKARRLMSARWGEHWVEPAATVAELQRIPPVCFLSQALTEWLAAASPLPVDDWRRRQTLGLAINAYIADLDTMVQSAKRARRETWAGAIAAKLEGLVDDGNFAEVERAREESSVLICSTHAGIFRFGLEMLRPKLPNALWMSSHGNAKKRVLAATDPVRSLYQIVKQLRTPGASAVIGADGRFAASLKTIDLLGLDVPVALGPPTIAHSPRCQTFFFIPEWKDDVVRMQFTAAPRAVQGRPIDEWQSTWLAAYRDVLVRLMQGAPENVRGYSGIFNSIKLALGDNDDVADSDK